VHCGSPRFEVTTSCKPHRTEVGWGLVDAMAFSYQTQMRSGPSGESCSKRFAPVVPITCPCLSKDAMVSTRGPVLEGDVGRRSVSTVLAA